MITNYTLKKMEPIKIYDLNTSNIEKVFNHPIHLKKEMNKNDIVWIGIILIVVLTSSAYLIKLNKDENEKK